MNKINFALPIFPEAVLYSNIIDINFNEILNFCITSNFKLTEPSKNKTISNNCFITEKLNVLEELHDLKSKIKKEIEYYLFEILKYKMDFKFLNSWITKTKPGGFSQPHIHCNSFLSGVYYPEGHKNFQISFLKKDKVFWDIQTTEENEFNRECLTLDITFNSTLILFPSTLKHKIEKNESSLNRYSIAFNINPQGIIGSEDTKILF
jgi:uncharacterized protein (TIGR02466 family)